MSRERSILMINIIIYFIITIGFWSFIAISSKGPKSYETSLIIKDIFYSIKELTIKIRRLLKLLIQDLIQESEISKTKKELNKKGQISIINESNYAEKVNELYNHFHFNKEK